MPRLPFDPEPLLRLFMKEENARSVVGDWEERFRRTSAQKGKWAAARWFGKELLFSLPFFIIEAMRPKPVLLSLRPIGFARKGSDLTDRRAIYQYEVSGLPRRRRIWIANFGGRYRGRWRILRATKTRQGNWVDEYETAEEALAVIQTENARRKPFFPWGW